MHLWCPHVKGYHCTIFTNTFARISITALFSFFVSAKCSICEFPQAQCYISYSDYTVPMVWLGLRSWASEGSIFISVLKLKSPEQKAQGID